MQSHPHQKDSSAFTIPATDALNSDAPPANKEESAPASLDRKMLDKHTLIGNACNHPEIKHACKKGRMPFFANVLSPHTPELLRNTY